MKWIKFFFLLLVAKGFSSPVFHLVCLADQSSLTGMLCAAYGCENYIGIDTGASFNEKADQIEAYIVSHPHLHRLSSFVINSPNQKRKNLYASSEAINCIRDHIFNWQVWPNYADEGVLPHLNCFHYVRLLQAHSLAIPRTGLKIEPLALQHPSGIASQAFLIEANEQYLVYLGDVVLNSLSSVWERVAPLIAKGKCRGIVIDSAAINLHREGALFGTNKPQSWMEELKRLAERVSPHTVEKALHGVKVIMSHVAGAQVKTLFDTFTPSVELTSQNALGLELIFPKRGEQIDL